MRLHDLTVTAFGPFAGTARVDFDELNDAGLFLMTGATGAGKSSLLDAVCFALYGTVPGARGVRTLKSQHAPAGARPEVVLDFSVQGRRFVVRRTPEWTRPKRRGTGTVTEKAAASIVETTGGAERFHSARAAEVGLLVGSLMGMNAGQFVQVALLPQGEFQTFLRASSQDRHDVLQQLFRTDRFARIEDWVGDHSRRLVGRADTGRSSVQRILDTAADRAGCDLPEELSGDALATAADDRVLPWMAGVLDAAVVEARALREEHHRAQQASGQARRSNEEAVRRLERFRRREAARHALADLDESEPAAAEARGTLAAHERAGRCGVALGLVTRAEAAVEEAATRVRRAVRALQAVPPPDRADDTPDLSPYLLPVTQPDPGPDPGPDLGPAPGADLEALGDVAEMVDAFRARIARLEALVPREQEAAVVRRARERDLALLRTAEQDLLATEVRTGELPAQIASCSAAGAVAAAGAARLHPLAAALEAARVRQDAAAELALVQPSLRALDDARRDARDRAQDAREALQSLVARRLAGMAAELAGDLADGAACQVCGSTVHPRRAQPGVDAVDERDHERADRRLAEATSQLDAAQRTYFDLRRRHDGLVTASGGVDPDVAGAQVAVLAADLRQAERAREDQARLDAVLEALRDEQDRLASRHPAAAASVATLREAVAAHDRSLTTVEVEVDAALGGDSRGRSVTDVVQALRSWCGLLVDLHRALGDRAATGSHLAEVRAEALAVAAEQGFDDLADVGTALLDEPTVAGLETSLRRRDEARARAQAVLDDPDEAADRRRGGSEPEHGVDGADVADGAVVADGAERSGAGDDPAILARVVAEAEARAADAARRLALHEERVASLTLLRDRLVDAVASWAPVRDQSLRAAAISRLVRGMGHDNQLQMRLSAYVLATRLDQVVAAANERLAHLRDQRYLLQRTGRAERRGSQAGLGLEVVDQWTGDVRSPTTLSGGETFVVSLSLALGLADVVTHESGGTEIETLFVDEGFGTLDADTLDDVMDRLDGLRAGGRTVGVVSHVTELRSRIPTQVRVEKGRGGSTVAVHTLVG